MALAADRNTPRVEGVFRRFDVAAGAEIHQGAFVVRSGAVAAPASTATGLVALGRAEEYVDNTGGLAGDKRVKVRAGIFAWNNSGGGDQITAAHIGQTAYIVDDETVALTDGTGSRSAAGEIWDVTSDGVWVKTGV